MAVEHWVLLCVFFSSYWKCIKLTSWTENVLGRWMDMIILLALDATGLSIEPSQITVVSHLEGYLKVSCVNLSLKKSVQCMWFTQSGQ